MESLGYRCDGRFLALNSYENRVYQVFQEDGERLVAKFYRPARWSDEAILEEHEFTRLLHDAEIPVVPPITAANGSTLFNYGGYRFSLFGCRGGRSPELDNPEHLLRMGQMVGRIHATGHGRSFRHRAELSIERMAETPSRYLLENGFIPDYLQAAYRSLVDDLITGIRAGFERAGTPRTICLHGDFHPGNILWTDQGPHIVDLDDTCSGPAIQDLWMFLSGDRAYMTAGLGDLMEGYHSFHDFDTAELNLIEPLRTLRMIHYAGWLAARWQDPAFPAAFPWFNSSSYWDNHILSLREQAALLQEPPLVWYG